MDLKDIAAGSAIDAVTDTLEGQQPEEESKGGFGSAVLRFFISIIWGIITFVALLTAVYSMFFAGMFDFLDLPNNFGALSVALCLIIFVITFVVPYLRKKGTFTRSCGILALGDALWWLYIMFTSN